jgi:hypothetical protein
MDAGTESAEWVAQEFARTDLRDKRLDCRLLTTAQYLAKSPASPINEACGTWASTQAAYRLFNNPKVSPAGILKPHWEATAARMAGCGGAVLVVQDTVFFSYGAHLKTRGLGSTGSSNAAHERGQARYAYRPVLIETFVEKPRFIGTYYKAANWQHLGDTQNRGKLDALHRNDQPIKSIWIYPLTRDFQRHLCTA